MHEKDLFAIAISNAYIAIGGLDNKISYWSTFTGSFKSCTYLPNNTKYEVFIVDLAFLKSKGNFVIAL